MARQRRTSRRGRLPRGAGDRRGRKWSKNGHERRGHKWSKNGHERRGQTSARTFRRAPGGSMAVFPDPRQQGQRARDPPERPNKPSSRSVSFIAHERPPGNGPKHVLLRSRDGSAGFVRDRMLVEASERPRSRAAMFGSLPALFAGGLALRARVRHSSATRLGAWAFQRRFFDPPTSRIRRVISSWLEGSGQIFCLDLKDPDRYFVLA